MSTWILSRRDLVGYGPSFSLLDPNSDPAIQCIAQPTDGCGIGAQEASEKRKVTAFTIMPSSVTARGGENITLQGAGFVPGTPYTLRIKKGMDEKTVIGNADTMSQISFVTPSWEKDAGTVQADLIKGKFWQYHGCYKTTTTPPKVFTDIAAEVNIQNCFDKCNRVSTYVIGITQGKCICYENKIAGSQLVTTNLITPAASSLCTKICTVPVKHICGSTTNDVYAFYQNDDNQGNKKEMPTEMFSIKMTAPDPITNLIVAQKSERQIQLSWNAPSYTGGGSLSYAIYNGDTVVKNDATDTNIIISNLDASRLYTFHVESRNGELKASRVEINATTNAPIAPYSPSWPSGEIASFTHKVVNTVPKVDVEIKWNTPTYNGNAAITSYELLQQGETSSCAGSNGNNGNEQWTTLPSTPTAYTIADVVPDTTHTFQIRAKNSAGTSKASETVEVFVPGNSKDILVDQKNGNDTVCKECESDTICSFPCATIGKAFMIANVSGQTIRINTGEYYANNVVPRVKLLKVIASNSNSKVLIHCERSAACFRSNNSAFINSNGVEERFNYFPALFDGLTIANGENEDGGCITATDASRFKIKDTIFDNCVASQSGGALYAKGASDITIENVTFKNNKATLYGGALRISATAKTTITKTTFLNNVASVGGAFALIPTNYGKSKTTGGNNAASTTDSISGEAENRQKLILESSEFVENIASSATTSDIQNDGGGIFMFEANSKIKNVLFTKQSAKHFGAGMFAKMSVVDIQDSQFIENTITDIGGGGGIGCLSSEFIITNLNVTQNVVNKQSNGGGASFTFCSPIIYNSLWSNNRATGGKGGGIYFGTMSEPEFIGKTEDVITFSNNEALNGGGISCNDCTGLKTAKVAFISNTALKNGGAIELVSTRSTSIQSTTFKGCSADNNGGALYSYSSMQISVDTSEFISNKARKGGGGGIYWGFPEIVMKNIVTINDLPIKIKQQTVMEINNTANYGNFIASAAHSIFMMDGPSHKSSTVENNYPTLEFKGSYEERIYQPSKANDWGALSGGQNVQLNANGNQVRYLKLALLDWYNRIVTSSSDIIKLVKSGIEFVGSTEIPCQNGIAIFDDFKVVAEPASEVNLKFEADTVKLLRGPGFNLKIRNCTSPRSCI